MGLTFEIEGLPSSSLLRALKSVAMADGQFDEKERALVEAGARLCGFDGRIDDLDPIEPDVVAARVSRGEPRTHLLQALLVVAIADGEASPSEWQLLERYRQALDIEHDMMKVFKHLAEGQLRHARYEILRRSSASGLKKNYEAEGWRGVYAYVRDASRKDDAVAALTTRVEALGKLDEGTLGRAFFEHWTTHFDILSKSELSLPDYEVRHDFLHVLSGYGIDPAGEIELAAFTAGLMRSDPFPTLFQTILQYNAGLRLSATSRTGKGVFEPEATLEALERGRGASLELADDWDPWVVVASPLAELRERYCIAPTRRG